MANIKTRNFNGVIVVFKLGKQDDIDTVFISIDTKLVNYIPLGDKTFDQFVKDFKEIDLMH